MPPIPSIDVKAASLGLPDEPPADAVASKPVYLEAVEGLRGIAALSIVVYHCFTTSEGPEWRPFFGVNVWRALHDGWAGVNLFLVLSGFCLFWPYARNPQRPLAYRTFMFKRVCRIVPAYYASLVLVPLGFYALMRLTEGGGLPWDHYFGLFKPAGIILHLLLLQALSAEAFRSWNGVAWSLSLEWTWYLFFPVAVWLFRKWGPARTVLLIGTASTAYCCGARWLLGPTSSLDENFAFTVRSFLAARLFEFAFGMLVAWWLANRPITPGQTRLAVVCILPLLGLAHLATPVDSFYPVRNALYGLAFSTMLFAAVSGTPNPVAWFCRLAWVQAIGQWSYSLYLFHLPVLLMVAHWLKMFGVNGNARFLVSLLAVPPVIVIARYCYVWFEQPFLSGKQRHGPAATAGSAIPPTVVR